MAHINAIKSKIKSTEQLSSVVSTMKALAAVNINRYEQAAAAIEKYYENIESAMRALVQFYPSCLPGMRTPKKGIPLAIVCGAQQSMAGPFNEQLSQHFKAWYAEINEKNKTDLKICAVGARIAGTFKNSGFQIDQVVDFPSSLPHFTEGISDIVSFIQEWNRKDTITSISVHFNKPSSTAHHTAQSYDVLPLHKEMVEHLKKDTWDSSCIPYISDSPPVILDNILSQHIFISIAHVLISSLAAENSARLAAMESAEKNITSKKEQLYALYNRERQSAITSELLDIISGVEALRSK